VPDLHKTYDLMRSYGLTGNSYIFATILKVLRAPSSTSGPGITGVGMTGTLRWSIRTLGSGQEAVD